MVDLFAKTAWKLKTSKYLIAHKYKWIAFTSMIRNAFENNKLWIYMYQGSFGDAVGMIWKYQFVRG